MKELVVCHPAECHATVSNPAVIETYPPDKAFEVKRVQPGGNRRRTTPHYAVLHHTDRSECLPAFGWVSWANNKLPIARARELAVPALPAPVQLPADTLGGVNASSAGPGGRAGCCGREQAADERDPVEDAPAGGFRSAWLAWRSSAACGSVASQSGSVAVPPGPLTGHYAVGLPVGHRVGCVPVVVTVAGSRSAAAPTRSDPRSSVTPGAAGARVDQGEDLGHGAAGAARRLLW